MSPFLIYEAKVAVALLVFYLFYRFLLKKETFHRFNRVVLVGTVVLSFLLPFCIVTIHKPMETAPEVFSTGLNEGVVTDFESVPDVVATAAGPWWPTALTILFFAGVAFVLLRVIVSILSILRIIRQGECVVEDDCRIIVTERDIDPFSWMRYIVLSRKDWEAPHAPILAHEKAHIGYGHSAELLLVDVLSAFQWFNPAIWMLRADLQELHEYEADDAVLRSGANLKEYQYLLIRKAVSKSGYSVANSFNHSILKNRITMMSKSRSPLARGWRALYLLPLVCLGIGLQARTVYVPSDKDSEKNVSDEKAAKTFVLKISPDGSVEINGKELAVADLKDYIKAAGNVDFQTTVIINAAADTPMRVVDEVKNELRGASALKVFYVKPDTGTGVSRRLAPERDFEGKPIQKNPSYPPEYPKEIREHMCLVAINGNDKVFFENAAYDDDGKMLDAGKAFVRKHGRKSIFLLRYENATSYSAYQHMQEVLRKMYDDLRDEKAQALYGKSLASLSETELDDIYKQIPLNIVEATKD